MGALNHIPALAVEPQQQPDPLTQYGKLQSIRALSAQRQQQQALAPGQLQAQQQQLEAGLLDNQMKQRQVKQGQALDAAYQGALTPDPINGVPKFDQGKVLNSIASSGNGSLIPQLTETFNTLDQKKAALLKTKQENLAAAQDYSGSLAAEVKSAGYTPAAAGIALAHLSEVDPNTANQLRQQFQQNPDSIKGWVDQTIAGSPKQREVAAQETSAQARQTTATTGANKPPAVDEQELNAYLKNPNLDKGVTKDAATYAAWKAKQSPAGITLNNQLGAGGQGSALDQAAQRYSTDGTLPAGFSRSPGTTAAILKRSAEMNPDQNIAANKATFGADSAALKKVQGTFDQVSAFENTAIKNLDLYVQKASSIPDIGNRFANVPLRYITKSMIGDANYAAMETARQTAATEAAKVLGSANASGVLSDSQKHEALDVLDGNLPLAATKSVVDTFKQDFANRHAGYQQDIEAIKQRLNPNAKPKTETAAPTTGGYVPPGAVKLQ